MRPFFRRFLLVSLRPYKLKKTKKQSSATPRSQPTIEQPTRGGNLGRPRAKPCCENCNIIHNRIDTTERPERRNDGDETKQDGESGKGSKTMPIRDTLAGAREEAEPDPEPITCLSKRHRLLTENGPERVWAWVRQEPAMGAGRETAERFWTAKIHRKTRREEASAQTNLVQSHEQKGQFKSCHGGMGIVTVKTEISEHRKPRGREVGDNKKTAYEPGITQSTIGRMEKAQNTSIWQKRQDPVVYKGSPRNLLASRPVVANSALVQQRSKAFLHHRPYQALARIDQRAEALGRALGITTPEGLNPMHSSGRQRPSGHDSIRQWGIEPNHGELDLKTGKACDLSYETGIIEFIDKYTKYNQARDMDDQRSDSNNGDNDDELSTIVVE
ncbi:hypothetical protein BKA67DRAFT_659170 [Truncatella angustata]|uniref:Uncharacterized protein n=1 Tax=Truncatella angustata TaxID=152316 RepID=A0A9P8ULR7_9PEZI|nr:uncharacterized protein BKA67DRAFT_659170 [Truncatella angustata]KAH6654910.1 hypothetical protein BKA67DRAFT_659170 [Truncatella angustata]